jgi:hypothetical protein
MKDKVLMAMMETTHKHEEPGFHIGWLEYDRFILDKDFEV